MTENLCVACSFFTPKGDICEKFRIKTCSCGTTRGILAAKARKDEKQCGVEGKAFKLKLPPKPSS